MPVARQLLVSLLAPILACIIVAAARDGTVDRSAFIPLVFALPGSLLLVAPAYIAFKQYGWSNGRVYALIMLVGGGAGAAMLGLVSESGPAIALGGLYGLSTALFWVILHGIAKRLDVRRKSDPVDA